MAFPVNGVLDDFNRANEGPPPSANWTNTWFSAIAPAGLKVSGNALASGSAGNVDSYWSASTFGPDSECYVTLGANPDEGNYLGARLTTPSTTTTDGYELFNLGSGLNRLYRIDDSVQTQLGANLSFSSVTGDGLGLEALGDQISFYKRVSGTWSLVGSRTDATYNTAGYIGAGISNSPCTLDDFGGGSIGGAPPPATTVKIIVMQGNRW